MNRYNGVEIAIVGMAGQFPGADDVRQFWNNLKNGKESISFFSDEELLEEGVSQDILFNPLYVKANAYLENKEYFDAEFFGYLPDEAKLMDPQIRLFHENCWAALEDAGYNVESNQDKIGLFAGGSPNTNWVSHSFLANLESSVNNFSAFHLRDVTFLCSRVSYLLNLRGPSIYLNTACSTSLVAVQRACMSLLLRECKMALAGGITITNFSKRGYLHEEGMIYSRDGHCRAFDDFASGTIGGEGVGVVVLKRLADAIEDGDYIYAIIKGSGINNDGSNKMAYTAPGIEGQSNTILKAISMAKVSSETITYVEAHGTATKLGDPVEFEALNMAFGNKKKNYCALGSVKTNIGHLDAAAGIAGLIKTVLALKHRQIPPSLNFSTANRAINFKNSPFYVNTKLKEWKTEEHPLRAGVSSFGIGGTNVHVVLEEAPAAAESSDSRDWQLLCISGKTEHALQRNKVKLLDYLKENKNDRLADIAYTLQVGRVMFPYREVIICHSQEEAISLLQSPIKRSGIAENKDTPLTAFMFPGQGTQYKGMCDELYMREEVFRQEADKCFEIVKEITGRDLKNVLFGQELESAVDIDQTVNTQPTLFIIEYALSRLLMHWGIRPGIMIGHSVGEYVAACIGGVFSLKDALHIVIKRGELMQSAAVGKMIAISITEEALSLLLAQWRDISLAAVNSTELCVVSGKEETLNLFRIHMEQAGYTCKPIRTSHAFHSFMMDEIVGDFKIAVTKIALNLPQIPFISNLTGNEILDEEATDPQYWVNHLRNTVQFAAGVESIFKRNKRIVLVEVGPGKALSSLVQSNVKRERGHKAISLVKQKDANDDSAVSCLLMGLGEMWANGVMIDWTVYYGQEKRRKLPLPSYSFEKIKYPVNVDAFQMIKNGLKSVDNGFSSWFYIPTWKKIPLIAGAQSGQGNKRNLIFIDGAGIGEALGLKFTQEGEEVVYVKVGTGFHKVSDTFFEIEPAKEDNYRKLFKALSEEGKVPERIIHGWSLSESTGMGGSDNSSLLSMNSYFYSLVSAVKTMSEMGLIAGKDIIMLTNDLHIITGDENALLSKTAILGFLKVISQEYPTVTTSNIDISLVNKEKTVNTDKLFIELKQKETGKVICLRKSQRWVQTYEPVETATKLTDLPISKAGVYLITGGLGRLGYQLAKCLVLGFDANVILLGRTVLPLKADWDDILKDVNTDKDIIKKIERIQLLESLSKRSTVVYLDADISDKIAFENALNIAENRIGSVNGVIHAAGIVSGMSINPIHKLTRENFEYQFVSKMKGIEVLKDVFKNRKLSFCLVTSSMSSILGGLGFAAYASANTFMDHYITFHKEQGELENWITVNLDGLNFDDSKVIKDEINLNQIWSVIERVLSVRNLPQVVVSVTDLQTRIKYWIKRKPFLNEESIEANRLVVPQTGGSEVPGTTEEIILQLWKDFFGKSTIEKENDFFDIGGDSLKALTMIGRIYKVLNVEVSVSEFFKRPSVKALSEYIDFQKKDNLTTQGSEYSPIPVISDKEYYKLSSIQRRLYFLYELNKESLAYNIPQVFRMTGSLDRNRLTAAFHKLTERHESLRTHFELVGDEPVQKICSTKAPEIAFFQCAEKYVPGIIGQFVKPFDLYQGPLLRLGLVEINSEEYLLLTDMHHIITDGVSFGILIKDFMAFYENRPLDSLSLQYKDYSEWQQGAEWQSLISRQKSFWINEFAEPALALELPIDYPRPLVKGYSGNTIDFEIGMEETKKLKAIASREGATVFMVVLSVYGVLLGRLSNQEDIVIGTPSSGRQHADLENIIGMFVNTLPLRSFPKIGLSFLEYLAAIKLKTISCFDNQGYQYENLIEELMIPRDTSRNPLFETMFVFQNFEMSEFSITGLTVKPYNLEQLISKFDISLSAAETDGGLSMSFEYSTNLFAKETIVRFISYFKKIVAAITDDPTVKLGDIDILPQAERHQLLHTFNDTQTAYNKQENVISLFEKQVDDNPDAIAVIDETRSITYRELNNWANNIAVQIKGKLPGSNVSVGLLFNQCIEMIVGMLAILKSGGAYIPLSPQSPPSRNNYVLLDCNTKLLLSEKGILENQRLVGSAVSAGQVITVERNIHLFGETENLRQVMNSEDLIYIIYTSGSTGNPKGVAVKHSGIVNMLHFHSRLFGIKQGMHMSQAANVSFDASAFEIWPCLTNGGCLHIAPAEVRFDAERMKSWLMENKIEVSFQSTALAEYLLKMEWETGKNYLKVMNIAGDRLNYFPSQKLPFKLFNLYGPTEDSIWTTWSEIGCDKPGRNYSIGKPAANKRVFILNKYGKLQPIGVAGELCISGDGLARGYINNEQLTHERFVKNPFIIGEKMYKTGDYAKWCADGTISFLGRLDDQVKIRGFRIELGEIESCLSMHPLIKEAVVIVMEKEGGKYLVAYYTSIDKNTDKNTMRAYLSDKLPGYMVPTYFIELPAMPLTENGKLNRKALPEPEIKIEDDYVAPSNEIEKRIVTIWSEILKIDPSVISVKKSFFELGGHSLKATTLTNRLIMELGIEISLQEVFSIDTVEGLSDYIENDNWVKGTHQKELIVSEKFIIQ
jgi:iturin family lipopeptide synthetase A